MSSARNESNSARPQLQSVVDAVELREKRYPPLRIALAIATLAGNGLDPGALLQGTGLSQRDLDDPDVRVSSLQLLSVARNAVAQGAPPNAGLRVGLSLHASSYGMLGYAMLCSATMRQAFDTMLRFFRLGSGMFIPERSDDTDCAVWAFANPAAAGLPDLTPPLYHFIIDMSMAALTNVVKDMMGPWCVPSRVRFTCAPPPYVDELARAFACQLEFDQPRNEVHYPADWLDRVPQLANPITASEVSKTCARLLDEFKWQSGATRRVYHELTRTPGSFPEIESVASSLCMTSRTLRRKLDAEGTSYSELLDSVRRALATDYLKTSPLDTEDIATALGFCDGASFRRAFKRWTGNSPSHVRSGMVRSGQQLPGAPPVGSAGFDADDLPVLPP